MFDNTRNFFIDKQYKNPYVLKRTSKSLLIGIFRLLFIIGFSYLFLFPVLYMLVTSIQSGDAATDPSIVWVPKAISFAAFQGSWSALKFGDAAFLSGIITIFSTAASIVSCSLVGYGFARFKFPLQNLAFAFVVLTIIVPPQTIMVSTYLNYEFFDFGGILSLFGVEKINLLNTSWVFVLPAIFAAGTRNGLFIFIFRNFFQGQPKDLEEAARIDGCGPFKTFIRIMVPLAGPAFTTVLLFAIVWNWNEYYQSTIYFTSALKPISVMLSGLNNVLTLDGNIGKIGGRHVTTYQIRMYLMAGCTLTILPPLLLYLFFQRYFTESIERTGLVG